MGEPLRQRLPKNAGISPAEAKRYLAYIAQLPCLYCRARPVQVCHVRFGETEPDLGNTWWRYGKRPTGAGEKPSDIWTWPGCPKCHAKQHSMGEREFHQSIDILSVCKSLQDCYPDLERAAEILRSCHE